METTELNTHYGANIKWDVYRNGYNAFVGTMTLNGAAHDISAIVFTAYIRLPGKTVNKLTLTEGSGLTNGGAAGTLTVVLTEAQLATLPADRYSIVIEYPIAGKGDFPLCQGFIEVSKETNPGTTTTTATIPVSIDGTAVSMAVTLAGGSGGAWGDITGTLSAQTDLQAALDAKISGTMGVARVAVGSGAKAITGSNNFIFLEAERRLAIIYPDGLSNFIVNPVNSIKSTLGLDDILSLDRIRITPDAITLDNEGEGGSTQITKVGPKLRSYTVIGVPSAATAGAGTMIFVSNETGGAVPAFSDGTNWRRCTDRNIIS